MNALLIDCETHGKAGLIRALRRLKSTIKVEDGGEYREDASYSQVWLDTTRTADEVDTWAYGVRVGSCVVGVVERKV